MRIVLDTNSLIRYFTNDIPQKAEQVEKLLKEAKNITIPEVVFTEIEYILLGSYDASRDEVLKAYKFLISQKNIKLTIAVKKAIDIYESSKLDMADSVIAAHSLKGKLASFDKELLKVENITPYWR